MSGPRPVSLRQIRWQIFCAALLLCGTLVEAAVTHRWSFSEASGTNVLDSIGAQNGYVVVLGTNFSRPTGMLRMAGGARAQTDYVRLPGGLVSGLTNVTVEIWATPRAGQSWSRLFDFGPGNDTQANNFYLSFCRGGTSLNLQRFEFGAPALWRVDTGVGTTVSNQYHYVVTWSATAGTGGGGLAQWYRDGVMLASTNTGALTVSNVNDTVFWLGRSQYPGDASATADYNEVRLYSHAMSPTEINVSRANGPDILIIPPPPASGLAMTTNANPQLVLTWTPGVGSAGSLVVMAAGQAPSGQPTNGLVYSASARFGNGQDLGGSNFVVHAAAGGSVTVSNLVPGVRYYASVYSYIGAGGARVYSLADPPTANELVPGTVQSISLQVPSQILYGSLNQAIVLANYVGGITQDVTSVSTYVSSATNVISVSTSGVLQGLNVGTALITATFQSRQDSNLVTVVNPLTDNLKHRYSFTADASDLIGTAHGTFEGGASIVNGAVALDGAGGFVNLPNNLVTGYTSITIETWATDSGSGGWARIYDFGNSTGGEDTPGTGTQYMFLSLPAPAGGNNLRGAYSVNGGGGNEQVLQWPGGGRPPVGQQSHIVWTSDGPTHTGRLYVDGVQVASSLSLTLTPADFGPTVNNWLGRSQFAADPSFFGTIDEFRIYDVALPPSLVLSNFQSGPNGLAVPPPVAINDSMTLNPGAMALIPVAQNDQGLQLDLNSVTLLSAPVAGTAQVKPGGKVLYTHNGGPASSDQFTYRIQNTLGATSGAATVFLTISNALRLPNTTITVPNSPPPTTYQLVDAFPGLTFEDAVAIRTPLGSSNQVFVVERRGIISYVPDVTATNPVRQVFMNISDQVLFDDTPEGEMGLLSMAFHPGFQSNGIFFVYYIAPNTRFDRLSRFTANPTTLTVNTNTQQILFSVVDEAFNHNGGDLHFGLDGYLYIGMGDEGDQYNFRRNSQRIDKDFYSGLLRIDVDKKPGSIEPTPHTAIPTNALGKAFYSIPADNPFVGATSFLGDPIVTNALRAEFFAVGFRHIWRFSIDPANGEIWAGEVGQDTYEEVDLVQKGLNYGWSYYEALTPAILLYGGQTTLLTNPPPSFTNTPPVWYYPHLVVPGGDPQYKGNSISGGVVYHGTGIPELTGSYIFGDFESANIWSLVRTNGVSVQRIAGQLGVAAFGTDPSNGDVLAANYVFNKVQRLVKVDAASSSFPQKLSDTGIFADLASLAPNPGVVSYDPIVAFWSDYAVKRRWFCIPDATNKVANATDANWLFPSGMKWIKHFDLELTRGNPASKKRIETRVLVKNDAGVYGVSYAWNDLGTEAFLVPDAGTNFFLAIQDGTNLVQQQVEIPSRSACLACHTPVGGGALSFNTRELNQAASMNAFAGNQLALLSQAAYLQNPVAAPQTLPAFATATNSLYSLEYRARSYLAENCVQCHQAGGTGAATWDARPWLTLDQTRLINGLLNDNGNNPTNRLVVPGDTAHSVLLQRVLGNGFSRMPPLATHQLDPGASNLLTAWIGTELANYLSFADWQIAHFGSTNILDAAAGADPDGDRTSNYLEYLTQTDPLNPASVWKLTATVGAVQATVTYPRVPNLGVVIETSSNLLNWASWDVPANAPVFAATAGINSLSGPRSTSTSGQYFRARFVLP